MRIVETAYNFYLFNEALFAVLFTVGCLLGERLYCIFYLVFNSFNHVDCGEVSSTDFLHGLELFVEARLIQVLFKDVFPIRRVLVWKLVGQLMLAEVESDVVCCHHEPQFKSEGQI